MTESVFTYCSLPLDSALLLTHVFFYNSWWDFYIVPVLLLLLFCKLLIWRNSTEMLSLAGEVSASGQGIYTNIGDANPSVWNIYNFSKRTCLKIFISWLGLLFEYVESDSANFFEYVECEEDYTYTWSPIICVFL